VGDRGHLQRDFKSYCRGNFSQTRQGRTITRYASFVAFNKWTDVNNACTVSAPANLQPDHDTQGTTVNWVEREPRLACCVCDNYQQAINTRAAPRFLLQPMQYTRLHVATWAVSALIKAIAVTGQIAGSLVSRDQGRDPGRPHGTRVSKYPGINIPSHNA